LFAIESRPAANDYLQSLADNGITSVLNDGRELTACEKQGRFIPVFMTMGRLQESSGYCAVLRDITQFKRTEMELEHARKKAEKASEQKSEFLARVSHEVRTPLNAIIGFSEIMLAESYGPIGNERYRDYLADINTSGNHVLQIINDLLDFSSLEAGGLRLEIQPFSFATLVEQAVESLRIQ
ncbi:MAG: PAS domain-containing sensor histidine kinase, partial [Planctomycetes bacterium]|nr:PAS domain-containing sensor histidine kinase [Planctomycetota bacterium]